MLSRPSPADEWRLVERAAVLCFDPRTERQHWARTHQCNFAQPLHMYIQRMTFLEGESTTTNRWTSRLRESSKFSRFWREFWTMGWFCDCHACCCAGYFGANDWFGFEKDFHCWMIIIDLGYFLSVWNFIRVCVYVRKLDGIIHFSNWAFVWACRKYIFIKLFIFTFFCNNNKYCQDWNLLYYQSIIKFSDCWAIRQTRRFICICHTLVNNFNLQSMIHGGALILSP